MSAAAVGHERTFLEETLAGATAGLEPIALGELGAGTLMDRLDTRFTLPEAAIPDVLRGCRDYRVLDIGGRLVGAYGTAYYDTPDLRFYHDHHSGRRPRYKVRVRTYLDSGHEFVEIKRRTLGGRTTKSRAPAVGVGGAEGVRAAAAALPDAPAELPRALEEAVRVRYWRLTLVRAAPLERVTLDFRVGFSWNGEQAAYPGLVVAEVKQPRRGPSPFLDLMAALGRRPGGLGKYCLGIATLRPGVRANRFGRSLALVRRAAEESLAAGGAAR